MNFSICLKKAHETKDYNALLTTVPYSNLLGIKAISLGNQLVFVLPPNPNNIGNPLLPAIHGGAIGGFMENSALFHVLAELKLEKAPKIIDFSIDYLRAGKNKETFACCKIVRRGQQVINVSISAWQTNQNEPIAEARAHLLTLQDKTK